MFSIVRTVPGCAAILLSFAAAVSIAQPQSLPDLSVPPAPEQITGPIDEHVLTSLPGNVHPLARTEYDHGRVADSLPQNHILMMLKRSPQQEQALDQFMRDQYNPQSANFHRWLTPEQFGALFGPSTDDIGKATRWLGQQGFTVNGVASGRTFIDFSGTAGQIAAAFHTEIHLYQVNGEQHYANSSNPMIPAALAPLVSGFRALNNFHPKPLSHAPGVAHFDRTTGKWSRVSPGGHLTDGTGASATYLVGPPDFAEIYGLNQVWAQTITSNGTKQRLVGTGQTIGVVGDIDLNSADIDNFRNQFGINSLGPNGSVVVDHPPSTVCAAPSPNSNDFEGYIDAEWAGSAAPDATIDFVVCADDGVTVGADLAAAYIIQDPTHAAQDSVLSTSWGYCEAEPTSESDQFYVSLWQQAAAEGITVVVAAGDAGSAECDEFTGNGYAIQGLAVSAEASTPYNIAAGGTDFSDVFSGTTANYWSAANGVNLQSALSYIPEMPWNDSCASPLVLEAFGQGFTSSSGSGGFCTYASQLPIDPNTAFSPYFYQFAGSGGLSAVSARPSWQTGVVGIPSGTARALPDISMFAGDGITWGHALLFCDSYYLPSGITCDFSSPANLYDNEAGGTSFVAPAFAGIMALINQKNGGRQGQANNILYPLAAQQYVSGGGSTQPSLANCAAYLGTSALSSCYFHDVSGTPNPNPSTQAQTPFIIGNISVPCTGSATAPGVYTDASNSPSSNSEDCYGYQITVTQNGSSLLTTPNYYGVVSTADTANSPAYSATPGYDLATGLGSPNAAALVNAPEWAPLAITTASLPPGVAGATYSQTLEASGRVPPYTWSTASGSLPPGLSLTSATGVISGIPTAAGASTFTVRVADSESTPATATASFTLTVAPAPLPSVTTLTSSSATVGTGMNVTFTATVSGAGGTPTGTVTFYNGTAPLGSEALAGGVATLTTSFSTVGTATIKAIYGGDANFLGSTSAPLTETIVLPSVAVSVSPTSVTIPFAGSGTLVITLTPQGGFAGPVGLSCGTLPPRLSCSFVPPQASLTATGGPVTDTLTINTVAVATASMPSLRGMENGGTVSDIFAAVTLWLPASFTGLLGLFHRKRQSLPRRTRVLWMLGMLVLLAAGVGAVSGCGRANNSTPDGSYNISINISYAGGTQSANATVLVQ